MRKINNNKIEIIKRKVILCKEKPTKYFFKMDHGFMIENLRFNIHIAKHNPKKMKLHITIWLPFIRICRDNSKWEIGNKYRLYIYH